MNGYNEFLTELFKIKRFGKTPNLLVMKEILSKLDNPQNKLKIIHIAGTNGKGSLSNYIAESLVAKGYKTGLFTSPYIHTFNERFKINGENISDERLGAIGNKILDIVKTVPYQVKQFDIITAVGLYYFYAENCDYVVLEAGMGGRNDSTNIVTPVISAIATIDLDHMAVLGDTIEKIAYEKAGIIKENIPLVYYPTDYEDIILNECRTKNSPYKTLGKFHIVKIDDLGSEFQYKNSIYKINMYGEHQVYNACLAIEVLETLGIEYEYIKRGLSSMYIEGRFEKISDNIYIDGGHNPQGARSIVSTIQYHGIKNPCFIAAIYKEKDAVSYLKELKDYSDIILTSFDDAMCHSPYELAKYEEFKDFKIMELDDVINYVLDIKLTSDSNFIFCGSLYQISQIKKKIAKTR